MNRTIARTTLAASSFALLTLTACSSYQSTEGVTTNKTTIAQAEKMYGEPSTLRYGADGSETHTWDSENMSVKFVNGVAVDTWTN